MPMTLDSCKKSLSVLRRLTMTTSDPDNHEHYFVLIRTVGANPTRVYDPSGYFLVW